MMARRLRQIVMISAFLALVGCQAGVAPFLDSIYGRAGVGVAGMNLEAEDEESDFPLPLAEIQLGTLIDVEDTQATGIELGGQYFDVGSGGDLEGNGFRILVGGRRFFRMDKPLRPHVSLGGSWTFTTFKNHDGDFDVRGPGGYVGLGTDFMLTPRSGIGLDGRFHVIYSDADRAHELVGAGDLVLSYFFRF